MNSKRALREIVRSVSSVGRQPKGHFYHGLLEVDIGSASGTVISAAVNAEVVSHCLSGGEKLEVPWGDH